MIRVPAPVLAAALDLAAEGRPVLFWDANKRPTTAHGFLDAVTDPAEVRRLASAPRVALLAVRMGEPSRLAAIDLDPVPEARAWFAEHRDRLPATRTHRTRRGGLHLIYRWPGLRVRSPAGKLALGVDVRADGSALTWWPAHGLAIVDARPLADLLPVPSWIVAAVNPPPPRPLGPPPVLAEGYARAALLRSIGEVARAPEGRRNATLNAVAYGLARLIGPTLGEADIRTALVPAAEAAGLPQHEAEATIASALRARGSA